MCFFYQTHPVAHAGMKMDYLDNTLAINVIRCCIADIKLRQSDKKMKFHLNVAMMSGAFYFQKEMYDSLTRASKC